jgi:predicted lipoprotein
MSRAWLAASLMLSSCVPWTVRPIEKQGAPSAADRAFDAKAYVDAIWESQVMPAVSSGAADLAGLLRGRPEDLPPAFLVKGAGRILNVDTSSRAGRMLIDIEPYDGRADAAIEIGPVLRGTALRDALPFIQFSQFVNQLEFARVGNALNERVWKTVLASLPREGLAGAGATFTGAASRPAADGIVEILPVQLTVTRRAGPRPAVLPAELQHSTAGRRPVLRESR